jgi:hypothetical protein
MSKDDRDVLEVLKAELDFIEKGGYGRSVRTPWLPTSTFQDAPSCVCFPFHSHDSECALMQLVPPEARSESIPCHHIPLNESGDTVAAIEDKGDERQLEDALKTWLRATIERIEEERAGQFVV